MGEGLSEESGGVREEEGVVRVEDGAVERVDGGETRGGVGGGVILGECSGDECSEVLVLLNALHHCVSFHCLLCCCCCLPCPSSPTSNHANTFLFPLSSSQKCSFIRPPNCHIHIHHSLVFNKSKVK